MTSLSAAPLLSVILPFFCVHLSTDFLTALSTTSSEMSAKVVQWGPTRPINPTTFCGEKASSRVAVRGRVTAETEMCWERGQEKTAYTLWTSKYVFPLYFRQQKITEREVT